MAMNALGAGFKLFAKDAATPVFGKVGRGFGSMTTGIQKNAGGIQKALSNIVIGMAGLKIGKAMMGAAKTFADAAGNFEKGLTSVALKSRATVAEVTQLHDKAIASAMKTQFSPDETIEAMENLATKGFDAADNMKILDDVLNLATAGSMNMNDAADAVSGTIRAMGYEVEKSTMVTDKLLKITQMTNFQTSDFSVGLARAASTAKLYGQSLSDTLINMGLLRNMNIEASVASTSLREAWRRLAADQKAQQAVQAQGVDIFDKTTGKIRPMLDVMADLSEKTKTLSDKERMRLATVAFGVRGMASFNAIAEATYKIMDGSVPIILKGQKAINAMRLELAHANDEMTDEQKNQLAMTLGLKKWDDSLKDATGTAEFFRKKLLDTYEGQKKLVEGAQQALQVVIGEAATKLFKPLVAIIYKATSALADFFNAIPMEARMVIIGVTTAIGALIATTGGVILLSAAFKMLGLSISGVALTMVKLTLLAVPIMVLLGGFALAAYAAYRSFKKNTGGISDSWGEMTRKIKLGWKGVVQLFQEGRLSDEMIRDLNRAENRGVKSFLRGFELTLERIKAFWAGVKKGFDEGVDLLAESSAFKRLKATFDSVFSAFSDGAENSETTLRSWGRAGQSTGERLASFGEMALEAFNKVVEAASAVKDAMAGITAKDIMTGLQRMMDVFNGIWMVVNKVATAVKAIFWAVSTVALGITEFVQNLLEGVWHVINVVTKLLPSKTKGAQAAKDLETAISGFKGLNFDMTFDAAKNLGKAFTDEADRMAEMDESRAYREDREKRRERTATKVEPLLQRRENILKWMALPVEAWRQTPAGQAGNFAFSEASPEYQMQIRDELRQLNKSIVSLGGQAVVKLDGEKVGEMIRRRTAGLAEDSLEEATVISEF